MASFRSTSLNKLVALCVVAAVIATFAGLGLVIAALNASTTASHNASKAALNAETASKGIKKLLLTGKTAGALTVKENSRLLHLLLDQQTFDHKQFLANSKRLAAAEAKIDRHIDADIASIDRQLAALKH